MDLTTYIEKIGDPAAAKLFSVSERTAASWRRRERRPRPQKVPEIIEKSGHQITYESIYEK